MFIGEAPGFHEDKQGEPFVGAAGQLLTRMLDEVLSVARQDVYIANVIKCRPPGNRDPQEDEIEPHTVARGAGLVDPTSGDRHARQLRHEVRSPDRARHHADARAGLSVARPNRGPHLPPRGDPRGGGESSRQFLEFREDFELVRETLATLSRETADPQPVAVRDPVVVPEAEPAPEEQLELF